ncbi:MAG: isoprenylcysteine carboxylmethyltransferase family protein [Actinobacteria bacterium]|nr:isoprenylcysteine carboxylmethyltransferase family protein [Actinomycetota bacterium]
MTAGAGSVIFFLVAPVTVAGVVPWLLTRWETGRPHFLVWLVRSLGMLLLVMGLAVLVESFVRFVREGRGTPAPIAPTEELVVGGLYGYVRNPMYLAVVGVIVGQALLLGRPILLGYGAAVWVSVAAFVRTYEEPTLRKRYGSRYEAYTSAVPAWWPRTSRW